MKDSYTIEDVEKMFPKASIDEIHIFHEFIYKFSPCEDEDTEHRFHIMLNSLKMIKWKCQGCGEYHVVDGKTGKCTECDTQNVLGG